MLLAVLMMSFAMFLGASMLAGIAEVSFLGSDLADSSVYGMLNVFITFGASGWGQAVGYAFSNIPEVFGGVVNAVVFNYAVLTAGEGILGGLTQMWVLLIVAGPILFYLFVSLLPWNTGS